MKNKYILFASIVIVLVLAIFIYRYPGFNQSNQSQGEIQLFSKYFKHYAGNNKNNNYSQKDFAIRMYNQKDYHEAIVNFKYALIDHGNDAEIRFYLGICFLATGDPKEAIAQFDRVLQSNLSELKDPGHWYKALSYLKLKNKEGAIKELKKISTESGFYENSQKLLKDMGS